MKIYTKLGDDLDMMIRSFETNPAVPDRQKEIWRQEGKKRAITHGMFGYDHEKALAFEDGTKVGSMKQNSARRFWDYAEGHVFPPEGDVARFCLFMHLDIYRTLTLLLKARWERFFAHGVNEWRAADGTNLTDILLDADEHALREALVRFQPRADDLYTLLTELACRHAALPEGTGGGMPFLEGHTPSTFAALIDEMLMGRYHFHSVESAELTHFTAQARKEFVLLVEGTQEQKRIYPLEKARWVSLRQELEDQHGRPGGRGAGGLQGHRRGHRGRPWRGPGPQGGTPAPPGGDERLMASPGAENIAARVPSVGTLAAILSAPGEAISPSSLPGGAGVPPCGPGPRHGRPR